MEAEYLVPATIQEAISLLGKHVGKAKIIAGGTDLMVQLRRKTVEPEYVIDITGIPGLDGISYDEQQGLKIGALATIRALELSTELHQRYPIMAQAASQVGSAAIRSVGTIGGNLCQDTRCPYYAVIHLRSQLPCYRGGGDICYAVKGAKRCMAMALAETAPTLICLGAEVSISGPTGERTVHLEDFFVNPGITALQEDEILTAIKVPNLPAQAQGAYLKHSFRGALDLATAGVATVLTIDNGVCQDTKIALLGVAPTPIRAHQAEDTIKGERINEMIISSTAQAAAAESHPVSDRGASAEYKREMVQVFTRRVIREALAQVT
jgi:carbon-monoxide dehydrogenase medium subunit